MIIQTWFVARKSSLLFERQFLKGGLESSPFLMLGRKIGGLSHERNICALAFIANMGAHSGSAQFNSPQKDIL